MPHSFSRHSHTRNVINERRSQASLWPLRIIRRYFSMSKNNYDMNSPRTKMDDKMDNKYGQNKSSNKSENSQDKNKYDNCSKDYNSKDYSSKDCKDR